MKPIYLFLITFIFFVSCGNEESSPSGEETTPTKEVAEEKIEQTEEVHYDESLLDPTGFELVIPDTVALYKTWKEQNYANSRGYLYLKENYKLAGPMDSVQYYGDSEEAICHFVQIFQYGISYSKSECSEEGGAQEKIILPRIDDALIHEFVNTLFFDPWNTWTTDLTYEADGAGCYYTIKQSEEHTIIDIYCGC